MTIKNETASVLAPGINVGVATLWASAFVIMAMIIVQAGRLGAGEQAFGAVTAEVADLRLLTSRSSQDEEILTILDQSQETLSAYAVVNGRSLELFDMIYLPTVFGQASRGTSGRR